MSPPSQPTPQDALPRPDLLAGVPPELWSRSRDATHRLLMLDYDGTLAPFRIDRGKAMPHPDSVRLLSSILYAGRTRVAIVSGRPVRELAVLVEQSGILAASWAGAAATDTDGAAAPLPAGEAALEMFGEHGWERRQASGDVIEFPIPEIARKGLAEATIAAVAWGDHLERKRSGLVLHIRGLEPEVGRQLRIECQAVWRPIAERTGLRLDDSEGGLELRAKERDKRHPVLELIAESSSGLLPVFLGDDVTDEDAFEVLRDRGFGVLVSTSHRDTHAAGRLPGPDGVVAFLERWWKDVDRAGA